MRPHHPGAEDSTTSFLSPVAQTVLALLQQRGALFFPDMVRGTGRLKAEVETGLWELVAAGLVTADGFENLRALVTPKHASGSGIGKVRRPRHAAGRWSLLHTEGADRDRSVESCCWMLLRRYGVVFRDLLARETNLPRWRELQIGFRRLENRAEVRGGRFVDGFLGEQFALPVAVESLRAHRRMPLTGRATDHRRRRPPEPGGHHRAGRADSRDLWSQRYVSRWSVGAGGRSASSCWRLNSRVLVARSQWLAAKIKTGTRRGGPSDSRYSRPANFAKAFPPNRLCRPESSKTISGPD